MDNPNKILIIRLGAVGDVIRTMPVLQLLKKKYANSEIDWIVEDRAVNILEGCKYINEIIIVPRKKIVSLFKELKFRELYVILKNLILKFKKKNYTIVYDFHGILKSGLFSYLTFAPVRIGFASGFCKELNFLFNNKLIKPVSKNITRIEKNLALIEESAEINKLDFGIFINNDDKNYINNFLIENQIHNKKIIGINPAASRYGHYKEWSEQYYGKLICLIKEKYPEFEFVLIWGPGEEIKVENIRHYSNTKLYIAPKTNLKQLTYLIGCSDFFITGDTGPMHLADAVSFSAAELKTKSPVIIALFGPSDTNINRPFKKGHLVIYKDVGCNPCRKRNCKELKCQFELTPEFVFEKIMESKIFD